MMNNSEQLGLLKKNLNHLIFVHININSTKNKFDELVNGIYGNIRCLYVIRNKITQHFPVNASFY